MQKSVQKVDNRIYAIRAQRVMIDRDLAELYQVRTIALRQQVKRNRGRFPRDFVFQLTRAETEMLVSQSVIPSRRSLGGSRPYAFTEQGVAMLSSVLRSARAVQVNIAIMRAFVKLRELMATHRDLARKIEELEKKYEKHETRMSEFKEVFEALRELIQAPAPPRRPIGFLAERNRAAV
jgi:hypothetical protein